MSRQWAKRIGDAEGPGTNARNSLISRNLGLREQVSPAARSVPETDAPLSHAIAGLSDRIARRLRSRVRSGDRASIGMHTIVHAIRCRHEWRHGARLLEIVRRADFHVRGDRSRDGRPRSRRLLPRLCAVMLSNLTVRVLRYFPTKSSAPKDACRIAGFLPAGTKVRAPLWDLFWKRLRGKSSPVGHPEGPGFNHLSGEGYRGSDQTAPSQSTT